MRDHTEREADTRRAYCEALQDSVIRILQEMATVQGRIKGRIKEDLERATNVRGLVATASQHDKDCWLMNSSMVFADVYPSGGTYSAKAEKGLL